MSYTLQQDNGAFLVYPLEIPMYEGDLKRLSQQLGVTSVSLLRHLAVFDYIAETCTGDLDDDIAKLEDSDKEHQQITGLINSSLISLVSIANLLGCDLQRDLEEFEYS